MKKNTENLIALIEPFLQSNYEWEKAETEILLEDMARELGLIN